MLLSKILRSLIFIGTADRVQTYFSFRNVKNILIISGCRIHDLRSVIRQVYDKYPEAEISVLGKEDIIKGLNRTPGITRFILYPYEGFMSVNTVGKGFFNEIKNVGYDLVIVAYNNFAGKNCINLDRFGKKCRGRHLAGFFRSGHIFPLDNYLWYLNFMDKSIDLILLKLRGGISAIIHYLLTLFSLIHKNIIKCL